MARKSIRKDNRYLAKLVTEKRVPCAFCLREVDDEVTYGKLYAIGDIQCHYFCCLLSCCLIQKGSDEEGLFGFMYPDILAELERCTKHKCSYCSRNGANLGCSVGVCRKQFHLPCGRERNAISLYYGSYKTFCQQHAPKQKIPEHIMVKAKLRMKMAKMKIKNVKQPDKIGSYTCTVAVKQSEGETGEETICLICYEPVEGFPTIHTFWPPCCAKDAWFHRSCLQRMVLSAGMHYLKCPLCNDKDNFYDAVVSQGYYVPDRDAAWELEQNAFAEIYERPVTCCADACLCPMGREHDSENGKWDIKLCLLCGSAGAHAHCITDQSQKSTGDAQSIDQSQNATDCDASSIVQSQRITEDASSLDQSQNATDCYALLIDQSNCVTEDASPLDQSQNAINGSPSPDQSQNAIDCDASSIELAQKTYIEAPLNQSNALPYVCRSCLPAAPKDLSALANSIEAIIQQEQAEITTTARRPVMPSRMSLRRTKRRPAFNAPSSSRANNLTKAGNESSESANTRLSRQELNLKTPCKVSFSEPIIYRDAGNKFLSPLKLLEQSFKEKVVCTGVRDAVLDESVIETLRRKFRRPRPLCEKKRIVNDILDGLFDNLLKNAQKQKEQVREWCSPKKTYRMEDYKELHSEPSESEAIDKENYFNTSNTPSKKTDVKAEESTTFTDEVVKEDEEIKEITVMEDDVMDEREIDKSSPRNRKTYKDTRNSISNATIIEEGSKDEREIYETQTINSENCRNKENSDSETIVIGDEIIDERENDELFLTNVEKCSNTSNSDSETIIMEDGVMDERESDKSSLRNREKYRNTRNSVSKSIVIKEGSKGERDIDEIQTINRENCRNTKNSGSKTFIMEDSMKDKREIGKTQTSNRENYISMRNSVFKTLIIEENMRDKREIEVTPTRNVENCTNTRNTVSQTIEKEKSNSKTSANSSIAEIQYVSEDEHVNKIVKPKNYSLRISPKILTLKKNKLKPLKVVVKSVKELSAKTIQNIDKVTDTKTSAKDNEKQTKSEPFTIDEFNYDGQYLRKLLTGKGLSSLILSDLINKNNDGNSVNYTPKSVTEIAMTETPGSIDTLRQKTIDIQQNSTLEISEKDQSINIDVIKINDSACNDDAYKHLNIKLPEKKSCSFKFSPLDKEILEKKDVGIDLENFKKEYLNEVDREFKCKFSHRHDDNLSDGPKLRTALDFAMDAAINKGFGIDNNIPVVNRKERQFSESGIRLLFDNNVAKKRKVSESDLKLAYNIDNSSESENSNLIGIKSVDKTNVKKTRSDKAELERKKSKRKVKRNKSRSGSNEKNIEVTIDSSEKRSRKNKKIKKKIKNKFAIKNESNIHVRIKRKKKQLSLNIELKKQAIKEKKDTGSNFKQYVLQFPEGSTKEVLVKPEKEVSPLKRKYVRQEKNQDNMKQMSIQSFFKLKSPEK